MSEFKNCERCGKAYTSSYFFNVCPGCFEQDESDFRRIKEYLYEHPGAKIFEVSTVLDISVKKIKRYLRENRLEILERDNQFLFCESCNRPIRSGKYCDGCYKLISTNDFKVIYTGNQNKHSNSINFKSKDSKRRL